MRHPEYGMWPKWRLLVENSIDGYHAASTHDRYFKYLAWLGTGPGRRVSGVTRDLGNGHAMLEYLAPPGAARSSSGNRCPGRPPGRESRRSVPGWPPNMRPNGPGGCAMAIRNMLINRNLIVNDIMA